MKNKTILYFFVFLLLITFNSAVKSPQLSNIQTGLSIEYPKLDFYKINVPIDFEFHVYNSSGFWLTNSSIRYCSMHIYTNNGTHFLKTNATFTPPGSYEVSTIFTSAETYSYIFYCEGITEYGFVSNGFIVNSNATNYDVYGTIIGDSEKTATIGFIILYVGLMILFVYLGYTFYQEKNMLFFLSFLFWYFGLLLPLFALRLISSLNYISTNMKDLVGTAYIVYLVFYGFMVLMLIVYIMALFFGYLRWDKKPDWMKRSDI